MRDFSYQNLKGQSLRNRNFIDADFTGADIRGTDFTGACLVNANFSHSRVGLSLKWKIGIVTFAIFLAILSGFITAYAGAVMGSLFTGNDLGFLLLGLFVSIVLTIFFATSIRIGLSSALGIVSLITATAIVSIVAITPSAEMAGRTAVSSLSLGGAIAGAMGLAESIALIHSTKILVTIALLEATSGAIFGMLLGVTDQEAVAGIIGVFIVSIIVFSLGTYMGWCSLNGDERYRLIRELAISITTLGGTSFRGANLTDANFTGAVLENTDFRGAILTRTRWFQSQLKKVNVERTYLENPLVRQLVTTGNGTGKLFNHLNLRGLNLQDASLTDASFIGADLSGATLQCADLSRAKLVQTQLYGVNLSEACLTGAYIQNWGISTDTKLEEVKCEYIYMHLPTTEDPDPCRKPDNRQENFREADFADFIAPIIKTLDSYQQQNLDPRTLTIVPKTLDLYHYEGIDPSAAAIALRQLIEQHPEAKIEVVTIEGRGSKKIRLQARVSDEANRSELNATYFESYNRIKALPYPDIQNLLAGIEEKDKRIRSLEQMVIAAIGSSKFYVETYQNQGDTMSETKGNIHITSGDGSKISGIAGAGENMTTTGSAIGEISGTVSIAINELPESPEPEKPGLKELLTQLQEAIEAEPNLDEEDKAEALEQVKAIAEAGQKPEDGAMQKMAKNAMKFLKGTIADLPSTVELVQTCGKILPLITKFFGLP
ncbi:pentapeptide repeat-containing protein [Allocoleopsis sp.]|uniref:pentapeptide repeat-containing protein n=1 Tax=Allocoleopsis sp. TaxID=3088169 RepID=UPI002FCF207E